MTLCLQKARKIKMIFGDKPDFLEIVNSLGKLEDEINKKL